MPSSAAESSSLARSTTREQTPTSRVNSHHRVICLPVVLGALAFAACLPATQRGSDEHEENGGADTDVANVDTGEAEERRITHWVAPMDPTFISEQPGTSPMGMDLTPVYEGRTGFRSDITIDPVVVQNMNVRIVKVRRGSLLRHIRAPGAVDIAQDRVSVVNLRFSGWIEHLFVGEVGARVIRGQPLFAIYSPELVSAQEEYLMALRSSAPGSPMVERSRARLELWDVGAEQIQRIASLGKPIRAVTVVAPQSGYVLHENVVRGSRVEAGSDLYRIGNLAKIWVNADVYELDAPWVRLGQPATVELSFQTGTKHEGSVAYIYPTLNEKTRTLTIRLEFDNPGLVLKPGMFASVQIEAQHKDGVLVVPAEAIIHSGTRQIVFVAVRLGRYEMREVTTGLVGDRYLTEVISGLTEGERIVASSQFMLDSESQLREAAQKLLEAGLHASEKRAAEVDGSTLLLDEPPSVSTASTDPSF